MSLLRKGNISGEFWLLCLPICIFYYFAQRWQNDSDVSIMLSLAFCTWPEEDHFLPPVVSRGPTCPLDPVTLGYKGVYPLARSRHP